MRAVVFYNGELADIDVSHFFQHPLIEGMKKDEMPLAWQENRAYLNAIRERLSHPEDDSVDPNQVNPEWLEKVEKGCELLELMVSDMFGKALAGLLDQQMKGIGI
jgi:hypothetical protein